MNTEHPNRLSNSERSGFALLTTLAVVALIAILVISLFVSVRSAARSSADFAATTSLDNLKDSAVSIAIAQIREASSQTRTLWTSQPGAIRTFEEDSGDRSHIYKLYSDDEMVMDASALTARQLTLADDSPDDWSATVGTPGSVAEGVYVDLNQPEVFASDGEFHFPIVDPRLFTGTSPHDAPGAGHGPEGFSYTSLHPNGSPIHGAVDPGGTPNDQRVPMPVRWIYTLADGSMGTLQDDGTWQPFQGQGGGLPITATQDNPIVGRMAFWTDDESCKLNVNTASEAIPWDTPRAATPEDVAFASQKPAKNEVQRFGGHPASTCLSSVLFPGQDLVGDIDDTSDDLVPQLKAIYDLVPRVNYADAYNTDQGYFTGNQNPVVFDDHHLYANIEEALLKPDRSQHDLFNYAGADYLARSRFFLTANSRSPDLTAAGTPRVALWPVHWDADYVDPPNPESPDYSRLTAFDNLVVFSSTLADRPYYFRRNDATNNTDEFNANAVSQASDPLGHSLYSNHDLGKYILWLARDKVQGYPLSIEDKYDPYGHHDQDGYMNNIATGAISFLDFMRQTNLSDNSVSASGTGDRVIPYARESDSDDRWDGNSGQIASSQLSKLKRPSWDPAPDVNSSPHPANSIPHFHSSPGGDRGSLQSQTNESWTRGTARENAISEFGIVLSLAAETTAILEPNGSPSNGSDFSDDTWQGFNPELAKQLLLPPNFKAIQIGFVAEGFCPSHGWSMISPTNGIEIKYTNYFRIGTSITNPTNDPFDVATDPERPPGRWWANGPVQNTAAVLTTGAIPEQHNPGSLWDDWSFNNTEGFLMTSWRPQDRDWFVGWGGSAGRKLFMGVDITGMVKNNRNYNSDPYASPSGNVKTPGGYSRGFFLVPSGDTHITLTSYKKQGSGQRLIWLESGDERDGGGSGKKFLFEFPAGGMQIKVPTQPAKLAPTWGERYAEATGIGSFDGTGNGLSEAAAANAFPDADSTELIDPNDILRTWVSRHGDYRLHYMRSREGWGMTPKKHLLVPHPDWHPDINGPNRDTNHIHSFMHAGGGAELESDSPDGLQSDAVFRRELIPGAGYANTMWEPDFVFAPADDLYDDNVETRATSAQQLLNYPYATDPAITRDFDNGYGMAPDGAYWGKPDDTARVWDGTVPPYFNTLFDGAPTSSGINTTGFDETIAPNQMVPSAVQFGSIPSAAYTGVQWTTYLFRPDIGGQGHLGERDHAINSASANGAPPDHLILDWFWMPIVQPYAVSERFSTAGRVNMNYAMAPFSYIKRATGMHAVIKSERLLAIPSGTGASYKDYTQRSTNTGWRHRIDPRETLTQFENKFNNGEVFRTASEICEHYLIPEGETVAGIQTFWNNHTLTGDNTLERPYANIYPRITTKSNSYRVHLRVQTLKKARSTAPNVWDEATDRVTGEYRGESLLERAINPNDPDIPDYVADVLGHTNATSNGGFGLDSDNLDNYYTYRVLYHRRFSP